MANSLRSLAKPGSLVGYGRYSVTSRAQRAAFGTPAARSACSTSAWLAVLAFTFRTAAAEALVPLAAGDAVAGQQTGRRSYRQLTITKDLDSASTALMSAVATNDEVKSAKLYLRKAGGAQEDYFCLTLEKARVASYDIDCDADGAPVERIAMSFQKVSIEYRTQNAKGAMGGTHTFDDDLT